MNNATCNGVSNGSAQVFVSGGIQFPSPDLYTYLWIPGGQTSQLATNLPGDVLGIQYSCVITDANGCQITKIMEENITLDPILIFEPSPLIISVSETL